MNKKEITRQLKKQSAMQKFASIERKDTRTELLQKIAGSDPKKYILAKLEKTAANPLANLVPEYLVTQQGVPVDQLERTRIIDPKAFKTWAASHLASKGITDPAALANLDALHTEQARGVDRAWSKLDPNNKLMNTAPGRALSWLGTPRNLGRLGIGAAAATAAYLGAKGLYNMTNPVAYHSEDLGDFIPEAVKSPANQKVKDIWTKAGEMARADMRSKYHWNAADGSYWSANGVIGQKAANAHEQALAKQYALGMLEKHPEYSGISPDVLINAMPGVKTTSKYDPETINKFKTNWESAKKWKQNSIEAMQGSAWLPGQSDQIKQFANLSDSELWNKYKQSGGQLPTMLERLLR